MLAAQSNILTLLALVCASTVIGQDTGDTVKIVDFRKDEKETEGSGNVAASGDLHPFGKIGVGCGINWNDGDSYGGGLTGGSPIFGLGGGFKIGPNSMTVTSGIGITEGGPKKTSANIKFTGNKEGYFQIQFDSTAEFDCSPSNNGSHWFVNCQTKSPKPAWPPKERRALLDEEEEEEE